MTPEERYLAKRHKKQLDEKYLQKQLIKLNENKSEILIRIRTFKRKHKHKYKNTKDIYLHQQQVIKLLNTNNRTIDLLVKEKLIKNSYRCMTQFPHFQILPCLYIILILF